MLETPETFEIDPISCYYGDSVLHVRAWLTHWTKRITHVTVTFDGRHELDRVVLDTLPGSSRGIHYRTLGYLSAHGQLPQPPEEEDEFALTFAAINSTHKGGDREVARTTVKCVVRLHALPPEELMKRVDFRPNDQAFLRQGFRQSQRLLAAIDRHGAMRPAANILDWGCGCGRVARHVLRRREGMKLFGCDIDKDAIRWMQQHFPGGSFQAIGLQPPTPYGDARFDLVYGVSVVTHLDEATQFRWLDELRRITAPGGLVLMSVRSTPEDEHEAAALSEKGFLDRAGPIRRQSKDLRDTEYYRSTVHSGAYIRAHWSRYFEILEITKNGLGRQDLVVMRRR